MYSTLSNQSRLDKIKIQKAMSLHGEISRTCNKRHQTA